MWNLKTLNSQRMVVARAGGGGGESGKMLANGYQHPVIGWISSRDLTDNMMVIVNNTVLYT